MKNSVKVNSITTINERLEDVFSITCVLSNEDSPDVVFEDIASLSSLSPKCEIKIVCEMEINAIFNAVPRLKEIAIIPPKEEKLELKNFYLMHKDEKADILYCRNAEKSPIVRKYVEKVDAGIAIFFGNPQKKAALKGQILRIEDETTILKNVMPFIPETKITWKLSAEILRIVRTFLKERGIKKDFFCVDVALEEYFYEFFKTYDSDKISFVFMGNTESDFSNETGKIIYSGDISNDYLSALISLSRGCLVYRDETLLSEAEHFEKKILQLDKTTMSVDLVEKFVDTNKTTMNIGRVKKMY